ncbi:MAG TPA: peptidylprolyl isomerase [Terracidiphilus sp.]|nr:peptidylprolyl isomerase [Terracidiphilus sp.]
MAAAALLLLLCPPMLTAQTSPASSAPVVLDRVVAVVNGRAVLASDLREELALSILEPNEGDSGTETPPEALQHLISRTLIRQQIREEDARTVEPTPEEVQQRIAEIRKQLPVCARENCATDIGWQVFLVHHGLTERRVQAYLRSRMEILRFIEIRFRQGIQISQQDVETYYRTTLVPQYQAGQPVPQLSAVAPRIEEILLQQQVNSMFGGWLDSLRNQGEVEVLDQSLESAGNLSQGGATSP